MLAILDVDTAVEGLSAVQSVVHDDNMLPAIGILAGLAATITFFLTPIILVLFWLRHRSRRQLQLNDVVLKLAEKGQPVPPELFIEHVKQRSDLRRGIVWASVGLGLVSGGAISDNSFMMAVGCIPFMMGIGFVIAAWLEQKQRRL